MKHFLLSLFYFPKDEGDNKPNKNNEIILILTFLFIKQILHTPGEVFN